MVNYIVAGIVAVFLSPLIAVIVIAAVPVLIVYIFCRYIIFLPVLTISWLVVHWMRNKDRTDKKFLSTPWEVFIKTK